MHDGDRIRALLGERNQAAFARDNRIPGGASMVSQHISGHRPVSLDAALAYAKGFGVPLSEISPAAAARLSEAAAHLGDSPQPQPRTTAPPALSEALPVVLAALVGLPPARAASVRAQLDLLLGHPEMRDDVLDELRTLLGGVQGKQRERAA